MFRREHHGRIARILDALDADHLVEHKCWFGGGTALALAHGEYRESVDIDFLVSDAAGYRVLREAVRRSGLASLTRHGLDLVRPPIADAYGIRAAVVVDGTVVKLEIVREGRIDLDEPPAENTICGVRTLTPVDQVASKLLANDDRWADRAVFNRDLIDLAMMRAGPETFRAGLAKAEDAYGATVRDSVSRAVASLRDNPKLLAESARALAMETPPARLWAEILAVEQLIRP